MRSPYVMEEVNVIAFRMDDCKLYAVECVFEMKLVQMKWRSVAINLDWAHPVAAQASIRPSFARPFFILPDVVFKI